MRTVTCVSDPVVALVLGADAPNAADWLEAVAAMIAAVGTVCAFVWQARALAQERKTRAAQVLELREEQRRQRESQARTVVVREPHVTDVGESKLTVVVEVANYGSSPVINVGGVLLQYKNEDDEEIFQSEPGTVDVLPAGEKCQFLWYFAKELLSDVHRGDRYFLDRIFHTEVFFTDTEGIAWCREAGYDKRLSLAHEQ